VRSDPGSVVEHDVGERFDRLRNSRFASLRAAKLAQRGNKCRVKASLAAGVSGLLVCFRKTCRIDFAESRAEAMVAGA
jgi:hypothetical protein